MTNLKLENSKTDMQIIGVFLIVFFILLSSYGVGYHHGKDKAITERGNVETLN